MFTQLCAYVCATIALDTPVKMSYSELEETELIERAKTDKEAFGELFYFLVLEGCQDPHDGISNAFMEAGIAVCLEKGGTYAKDLLKVLRAFIDDESGGFSEESKNSAILLIGSLAKFLDQANNKQAIDLASTYKKMMAMVNIPSERIRISITKCLPLLAKHFEELSREFLHNLLTILTENENEHNVRGAAFAIAGIVKGLGMRTVDETGLLNVVDKQCFRGKGIHPLHKAGGIYLYETLSIALGKSFESYLDRFIPNVLLSFADPKEIVRTAA